MDTKNKEGRPTKYTPQTPQLVDKYLESIENSPKHLPKIYSLAIFLGVNTDTIHEWEKKYPEFSVSLSRLKDRQAQKLVDDGIYGNTNPTIVKLMLMNNHGMKERNDTTSNDKPLEFSVISYKDIKEEN